MDLNEAIQVAKNSMKNAYAPYSKYFVGAALVSKSGKIYSGSNIENHGIMAICAERVAFTKAISEGEREFKYIVICSGKSIDSLEGGTPCGYCRQFMSEFVGNDFKIYVVGKDDKIECYAVKDLLPHGFELSH